MKKRQILLLHAWGQSVFDADAINVYGTLDKLLASDTLQGFPDREASLTNLWEAAHRQLQNAEGADE